MEITKKELQEQINKLQEQLNNFKEPTKFIEGKWYIYGKDPTKMACYTLNKSCYGIWGERGWSNSLAVIDRPRWTEAANEEVEAMLITEATIRGYMGRKINSLKDNLYNCKIGTTVTTIKYDDSSNILYSSHGVIFKDGKWAEIIKDSKPKVNGYEMEVNGDKVSFGCARFTKKQLLELRHDIISFNEWKHNIGVNRIIGKITLDSGVEITVAQLKEITNYLKNE